MRGFLRHTFSLICFCLDGYLEELHRYSTISLGTEEKEKIQQKSLFDYLDGSDRLGLKLASFGVTFISNIFDSLEFNRNDYLVVIQDNSELLATLSETTVK